MESFLSWPFLAVAATTLVLILFGLRMFGKVRFTFRFKGAVTVSPWAQKPCPHLGLLDDPFLHRDEPTEEHRCYLWMQRDRIDLTHQKGFCLSSAHTHCPWLSIAPPVEKPPLVQRLKSGVGNVASQGGAAASTAAIAVLSLPMSVLRKRQPASTMEATSEPTVVAPTVMEAPEASAPAAMATPLSRAEEMPVVTRPTVSAAPARPASQVALDLIMRAERAVLVAVPLVSAAVMLAIMKTVTLAAKVIVTIGRSAAKTAQAVPVWLRRDREQAPSQAVAADGQTLTSQSEGMESPALPIHQEAELPSEARPQTRPGQVIALQMEDLIEQGKAAGMGGNRKLAYSLFSAAVELDPNSDEAWLWKGAMAESAAERLTCIQQALAINPDNQRAQQALLQMNEETEAAAKPARRRASAKEPKKTAPQVAPATLSTEEALIDAALASLESGDENRAYRLFVSATEMNHNSEKAWFWRAKTATTLEEVVYCLQQALAVNPDNEKVKTNLVWAMQRQQKEQQAKEVESNATSAATTAQSLPRPSRNFGPALLRTLAATACLALAAYWVLVAILPLFNAPVANAPGADATDLSPARPAYEISTSWLPELNWKAVPGSEKLQVSPNYNLLAALPYTLGFLYFFVAIGIFRRESWARYWGLAITVLSMAMAMTLMPTAQAMFLVTAVGLLSVLALAGSWTRFGRRSV